LSFNGRGLDLFIFLGYTLGKYLLNEKGKMTKRDPIHAATSRQHQAQARREQIIEAAVALFAQQGFDGTSTKQIAHSINITEGLIFHYFPTKADLLSAVLSTRHGFIGELRQFLVQAQQQPADEVLPEIAAKWLQTLRNEMAITLVLFGTAQTNQEVQRALQSIIQEGIERLANYLRARIQAGELRTDLPVETSAHMFFASLMIFFLTHRTLSDSAWEQRASVFSKELYQIWRYGTTIS
jgi:AcrR family transcriptional regulator